LFYYFRKYTVELAMGFKGGMGEEWELTDTTKLKDRLATPSHPNEILSRVGLAESSLLQHPLTLS
jgi:hypothetical protein